MKATVAAVALVVMLSANVQAFWFFGGRNEERTGTADGRSVSESCVSAAENGDCEFFNCFEERLPCGREYYMQRFGNHYCTRFNRQLSTFTQEGQDFIRNSQQCVTQGLIAHYRREYVNCHDLEHDAIALIRPCYIQYGFCDIIGDNADQFLEVFSISDLFRTGSGKLWREVVGLARECGGQALRDFWRASASRLNPFSRRK